MQQTPPLPPPPPDVPIATPPEVGQGVASVVTEINGMPAILEVPRTAAQVQGTRARAEEIRNQIEQAQDQRQELVQQLQGEEAVPAAARPGIEQQLRVVDARILQLEQDLTTTNRVLTAATPEALAQALQAERDLEDRRNDSDDEENIFAGGAVGVFLTLAVLAVRRFWRRRRDRGRPAAVVAAAGGDDPRFDRLAQAVDAIAVEVERIGEGQRFVTQLLSEERDPRRLVGVRPEDAVGERHR